jgi:hypothetical protein
MAFGTTRRVQEAINAVLGELRTVGRPLLDTPSSSPVAEERALSGGACES